MKIIISEEQFKQFLKSSPVLQGLIEKYLNKYISKGIRKIGKKSRNYGNFREDWCIDGAEVISMIYYFEDGNFHNGSLFISKDIIEDIQQIFTVKESFILHVIEEWYEDTMIPQFESTVGESGFYVSEISKVESSPCVPEPVKPEGITNEEMIDFIVKNTAYRRQEVINKIRFGERDLEDFYLDVVETVERKKYW
jgi:hypothetical protein